MYMLTNSWPALHGSHDRGLRRACDQRLQRPLRRLSHARQRQVLAQLDGAVDDAHGYRRSAGDLQRNAQLEQFAQAVAALHLAGHLQHLGSLGDHEAGSESAADGGSVGHRAQQRLGASHCRHARQGGDSGGGQAGSGARRSGPCCHGPHLAQDRLGQPAGGAHDQAALQLVLRR
jgi:hypothetical protein